MPYPRPSHTIELTIPHILSDVQFDELEDLAFHQFEDKLDAWPISLKITSSLEESSNSTTTPPTDGSPSFTSTSTPGDGADTAHGSTRRTERTTISIATSTEWDVESEEKVREIVRNLLIEIMGGG
ncbi:hypothetical protein CI109_100121 [Kwoniella shandongensis]|uniref:Uncharacterized protein n=1 Tax=Kwoniella shandongensis TaxID=1734106 RepID=A0A5M6BPK7_9TREE|nr:uncharacterized protein CI109_006851 [Kwoniella shandongensis]KAA5524828.1 hypothetical protein CI109_006851 [Kwoniella shandongensis]